MCPSIIYIIESVTPMNPDIRLLVGWKGGWSVGRFVKIALIKKAEMLLFTAPYRALFV